VRLDKFIHQNLEMPLHLYRGSHEHGTGKSSLLLADHHEDEMRSYQSSSTSGRDHVDAGPRTSARTTATGRWATSRWYLRTRHFRFRWTANLDATLPRHRAQERLHHQPGREL